MFENEFKNSLTMPGTCSFESRICPYLAYFTTQAVVWLLFRGISRMEFLYMRCYFLLAVTLKIIFFSIFAGKKIVWKIFSLFLQKIVVYEPALIFQNLTKVENLLFPLFYAPKIKA